jgi:hypothetical protein
MRKIKIEVDPGPLYLSAQKAAESVQTFNTSFTLAHLEKCPVFYYERHKRTRTAMISWHQKAGPVKTLWHLDGRKFPFETSVNGKTWWSDKIQTVVELIRTKPGTGN